MMGETSRPGQRRYHPPVRRLLFVLLRLHLAAGTLRAQDADQTSAVHLGGFGSLDVTSSSKNHQAGFRSIELDLYTSAKLAPDWSTLAEVVVQHVFGRRHRRQQ